MPSKIDELLSDVNVKVFDQEAASVNDIQENTGLSRDACLKLVALKVKSGEWEQVWKRVGSSHVRAYRKVVGGGSKRK